MPFIRVIDLETSHDTPELGGVVEVGYCDLHATRFDLAGAPMEFEVDSPRAFFAFPGCPIPPITAAVHHIMDEDVCAEPPWREVLRNVVDSAIVGPEMIALAAHSAKFEQLWTKGMATVPWLCTYKLALRFWQDAPSHSNMALRYWRKPAGLRREGALPAHRAGPDAYVTAHHLRDLLEEGARAHTLSIEQGVEISSQPGLQVNCHIGDWRGRKWADVDDGFMRWILSKDFDEDVRFTCTYWLDRRQKEWEAERAAKNA